MLFCTRDIVYVRIDARDYSRRPASRWLLFVWEGEVREIGEGSIFSRCALFSSGIKGILCVMLKSHACVLL